MCTKDNATATNSKEHLLLRKHKRRREHDVTDKETKCNNWHYRAERCSLNCGNVLDLHLVFCFMQLRFVALCRAHMKHWDAN